MKINKENYIEYFIAYCQGMLHYDERKYVDLFLIQNPELKTEFYEIQKFSIKPNHEKKQDFSWLKKDINQFSTIEENKFDEFCIAELEGDLYQKKLLYQMHQIINSDSQKRKTYDTYKHTKLKPNTSLVFPNKNSLKKIAPSYSLSKFYMLTAIAGSIIFVLIVFKQIINYDITTFDHFTTNKNNISVNESTRYDSIAMVAENSKYKSNDKKTPLVNHAKNFSQPQYINKDSIVRSAIIITPLEYKTSLVHNYWSIEDFYKNQYVPEFDISVVTFDNKLSGKYSITTISMLFKNWLYSSYNSIKLPNLTTSKIEEVNGFFNSNLIIKHYKDSTSNRRRIILQGGEIVLYFSYHLKDTN